MPPKKKALEAASKKTVQKKKQQIVEDKTFGLKNKNKSKKVQQTIKSIEKNVMNSGDPKQRKLEEQRAKLKAERKAKAKAAKAEQEALFGEALLAVSKKKTLDQKGGKIEAQGRDANDEATKKSTSRAMKMMYQMDAKEMEEKLREDVSTLRAPFCVVLCAVLVVLVQELTKIQCLKKCRWTCKKRSPTMSRLLKTKLKCNDRKKWRN